ncbi:MAG: hypothetical protein WCB57_02990 [Pseudonocardiaceae bacterium]
MWPNKGHDQVVDDLDQHLVRDRWTMRPAHAADVGWLTEATSAGPDNASIPGG